jgi:serine/threonine protein kinase
MQAAHQVKIIHCDLKPPNVLSSDAGIVKIVDFGLTAAVSALRAADPLRRCPHVFPAGVRTVSPCSRRSHSLPFPQVVTMAE